MKTIINPHKQIETFELPPLPDPAITKITKGFAKRFPTVKARVKSILKNDEFAMRMDWWLIILYWVKCGYIKVVVPKEKLLTITAPESITRAKRKLIEEAKTGDDMSLKFLLKDDEELERRQERQREVSKYFSDEKKTRIKNEKTKRKYKRN